MKIGFIILNYNTPELVSSLLNNLQEQKWKKSLSIYIVDNGSKDKNIKELKDIIENIQDLNIKLIMLNKNYGFAKGNNVGIKSALKEGCDFIICSNTDIKIVKQNKFIDTIKNIYNKDKNIAIIAPTIINKEGLHQNPFRKKRFSFKEILKFKLFYLTNLYKVYYILRVYVLFNIITFYANKKRNQHIKKMNNYNPESGYIYAPHGSFVIFTPSFFRVFNGFDENTFLYCEEFILAEKIYRKNLKVYYENSLKVLHDESMTTNQITKNYRDKVKFTLKHTFQSCKYFAKIIGL